MKKVFLYILLSVLFVACLKDEDVLLTQDDIISIVFETDTSNLYADNNSIMQFKAIITPDAKESFRNISFSATEDLGEFQGTVKEKKNIVFADQTGVARSAIKLGSKPGIYFLSSEVTANGKTYKSKDYLIRLRPLAQNDLIKLEFESDIANLRADNQSIIKLKATVPPNNSGETRTVTFIATDGAGDFKGTGATIIADQEGIARANLQVGGTAGEFFFAAEVKIGDQTYRTADVPVELFPVPANEKISITLDNPSPPADGFTIIKVKVSTNFTKDKTVSLTSNAGTFIHSSNSSSIELAINDEGISETDFRISSEVKPHILSATISETPPVTFVVSPVVSYPELILLETSSQTIEIGGQPVILSAFLRKQLPNRFVTKGLIVGFKAYQEINNQEIEVGRFTGLSNSISSIDGSVPDVSFFADSVGIDKSFPIIIEVFSLKNETEKIIEKVILTVI